MINPKIEIHEVHGAETEVFLWGDPGKPKVFLFHGFLERGVSFHPLCQHLARNYLCIALDLRGFGPKNWTGNSQGYFYEEYVSDMHSFLESFVDDEPARIVGFSMGGNICSIYAGVFPERIASFVNLEGIGIPHESFEEGPVRMRNWILERKDRSKRKYGSKEEYASLLRRKYKMLTEEEARVIAESYLIQRGQFFERTYDPKHHWPYPMPFRLEQRAAFWKRIEAPILLLLGRETKLEDHWDNAPPLDEALKERMGAYPKHLVQHWIEGAGHQMHWEKSKEVAAEMERFWNSLGKK